MIYKREEFIEENVEDKKFPVKQIECLSATDGSDTKYLGRLTMAVQTPMGVSQMPITFEIDADGIEGAFQKFSSLADKAVEDAKKELEERIQEARQKAQSRIVTPDQLSTSGITQLRGMGGPNVQT